MLAAAAGGKGTETGRGPNRYPQAFVNVPNATLSLRLNSSELLPALSVEVSWRGRVAPSAKTLHVAAASLRGGGAVLTVPIADWPDGEFAALIAPAFCGSCTLNATGQYRVTLSLR